MAISHPRAQLTGWASTQDFFVDRRDGITPDGAGRLDSVKLGWPVWQCDWTVSDTISRIKAEELEAWVDSLEGSRFAFYAADHSRPYPLAYRNGFVGLTRAGG